MTLPVTPNDLGTYLNITSIDAVRAATIIAAATSLCQSVVSPLPTGADAVILDVSARAWTNPTNVTTETVGPYSAGFGSVGGGLWLTRQNRSTLRRLAGLGGAFTIDTLPATAGQNLPWWDAGISGALGDDGCWTS